jgi:hypothetical protein
MSELLRPGF